MMIPTCGRASDMRYFTTKETTGTKKVEAAARVHDARRRVKMPSR